MYDFADINSHERPETFREITKIYTSSVRFIRKLHMSENTITYHQLVFSHLVPGPHWSCQQMGCPLLLIFLQIRIIEAYTATVCYIF